MHYPLTSDNTSRTIIKCTLRGIFTPEAEAGAKRVCVCKHHIVGRKRDNADDLNFHYSFIINLIKLLRAAACIPAQARESN